MRKVSMLVAIGATILFQGTCLARPSATLTTAAAGTIDSDYQDTFTGQSAGATGYVFVNGVGWHGARMIYCPAHLGFIEPNSSMIRTQPNVIKDGLCSIPVLEAHFRPVRSTERDQPTVSAQGFVDQLLGAGTAKVVSVAPVLTHWGHFGIIYYREITQGKADEHANQ